jgi:hypothetical protein
LRCLPLETYAQHAFTSKQLRLPSDDGWRLAAASVGSTPDRVMRVKQVHGAVVRVLRRGQVPADASIQRPDGDALVSDQPGLVLAVMVADCVPLLLVDPKQGVAAAVHAGWRGTCSRVTAVTITTMARECGCVPSDLIAAIGPSAGPAEYQVGESLIDAFGQAGHARADIDRWFIRGEGALRLDLWSANRDQLVAAGVAPGHIHVCGLSTIAHPDVFDSYRVAGEQAGRMAGLVRVPS